MEGESLARPIPQFSVRDEIGATPSRRNRIQSETVPQEHVAFNVKLTDWTASGLVNAPKPYISFSTLPLGKDSNMLSNNVQGEPAEHAKASKPRLRLQAMASKQGHQLIVAMPPDMHEKATRESRQMRLLHNSTPPGNQAVSMFSRGRLTGAHTYDR